MLHVDHSSPNQVNILFLKNFFIRWLPGMKYIKNDTWLQFYVGPGSKWDKPKALKFHSHKNQYNIIRGIFSDVQIKIMKLKYILKVRLGLEAA